MHQLHSEWRVQSWQVFSREQSNSLICVDTSGVSNVAKRTSSYTIVPNLFFFVTTAATK
jgi:hypothetical protein